MTEGAPETTVIETEEEYQRMKAATAAYEAQQAAQQRAAYEQHMAPLRAAVNSDAFTELQAVLSPLVARYLADANIEPHLRPLPGFLDRLKQAAG